MAKGEIPDLWEAFDAESIQHLHKLKAAQKLRDPYQGMTMKDMYDQVSQQADKDGLIVDKSDLDRKRRELAAKLSEPLFKGVSEED